MTGLRCPEVAEVSSKSYIKGESQPLEVGMGRDSLLEGRRASGMCFLCLGNNQESGS